ncbi:MAG: cellulose binding domain-containing protein [Bacteroidota bacterium]
MDIRTRTFSLFLLMWALGGTLQAHITSTCDGGTVATEAGTDTAYYCINGSGGGSSVISFDSTTAATDNFAYVVTSPAGIILGLPPGDMVDFAPAGAGECWVWGLSYTGSITANVGDDANTVALSNGCFDLSDNYVVVYRDDVDGGMVYNADGGDTSYVCIDGTAQVVSFTHMNNSGPNFRYVVTDPQGNILGLPPGNSVDFAPAGVGECWVWGLGYSGDVTAQVGDNALTAALTDGCFDLSDNFLVVLRDDVDGGMVYNADGGDTSYVCIDGTAQVVSFTHMNNSGPNFRYVVTDPQGNILGLPPGNSVDFAPAGVGECWVWGLGYSGDVTAQVGDNALTAALTDGCFDLSDNFLVVLRTGPELSIKYKNSENGPNAVNNKSIKPQIRVMNDGCAAADLSRITMRYWFTEDVSGTYTATCKSSDAGCSNTTLTLGSLNPALSGADSYLEVGFTSGSLAPGARVNTNTIIRRKDGNSFDESDDHSFIGIITNHVYNDNITLYYDGVLIAGTEPAPLPPAAPLQGSSFGTFQSFQANIFPNPFSSSLKIELNDAPSGAYDIRIMNINGQEVFKTTASSMSEDLTLPNIPAGMYLIQLRLNDQIISKRVMKK